MSAATLMDCSKEELVQMFLLANQSVQSLTRTVASMSESLAEYRAEANKVTVYPESERKVIPFPVHCAPLKVHHS